MVETEWVKDGELSKTEAVSTMGAMSGIILAERAVVDDVRVGV